MGATVRPREFDVDQPSQTEQLANWISKVRSKKIMCRRNRKRNLRVEAVLTYVLSKAEFELRNKQSTRIMRWQKMKQRLFEDMDKNGDYRNEECKDGDFEDGANYKNELDSTNCYGVYDQDQYTAWSSPVCPELSSLDSFMSQLSEIKVPLQR